MRPKKYKYVAHDALKVQSSDDDESSNLLITFCELFFISSCGSLLLTGSSWKAVPVNWMRLRPRIAKTMVSIL